MRRQSRNDRQRHLPTVAPGYPFFLRRSLYRIGTRLQPDGVFLSFSPMFGLSGRPLTRVAPASQCTGRAGVQCRLSRQSLGKLCYERRSFILIACSSGHSARLRRTGRSAGSRLPSAILARRSCRDTPGSVHRRETKGIDVAFWFMEDATYTAALKARVAPRRAGPRPDGRSRQRHLSAEFEPAQ